MLAMCLLLLELLLLLLLLLLLYGGNLSQGDGGQQGIRKV